MNNKFQAKSEKRNMSTENFNLNRGMDVFTGSNDKPMSMLNDRDMFNHFSNTYEQIDMTNIKPNENAYGMPLFSPQILNNKKSLINNPYIQESNNKTNFRAVNTINNNSSMYASFADDNASNNSNNSEGEGYGYSMSKFSDFDKIKTDKQILKTDSTEIGANTLNNSLDVVERGILVYEYVNNMNKEKNFQVDISSPFGLAFLWKSLILLSKNPSTDKLTKLLQIKNKDQILNDMKFYSEIFNDMGELEFSIPHSSGMINSNFTKKLEEIYKIKVKYMEKPSQYETQTENALITLKYKFELKIPYYYQPTIVIDSLLDYSINKIKFLKLLNVPCSLEINRETQVVNLEFEVGDKMILGFVYDLTRKNLSNSELLYDSINKTRPINKLVKVLYIPKISRNKKTNYGKRFSNDLKQIHLGEIIYGNMYDIDIITEMTLDITVDKNLSNSKYQINSNIDEIKINHRCYFYMKNMNIKNRILFSGMIEY
jgi:hypothetical protein